MHTLNPLSRVFFATVITFLRDPKLPFVCFRTFFLLALDATAFTDLGITHFLNVSGLVYRDSYLLNNLLYYNLFYRSVIQLFNCEQQLNILKICFVNQTGISKISLALG